MWNGFFFHSSVDCGPPPPVPLSSVIPGGSNFEGHSRQYQCDPGYALDPNTDVSSMVVTCQASGQWTESNFQCIVCKLFSRTSDEKLEQETETT